MSLNSTTLLASSAEFLTAAGYRLVASEAARDWQTANSKLFEDPYSLVGVVVYDTWSELAEGWPDAQARLVDTMATRLRKTEPKTWDGYVVLLTPGYAGSNSRHVSLIRYDTTRVRKLVASGEDLRALGDVRRAILPLLPLLTVGLEPFRDMLAVLKETLATRGIARDDAERVISAFSKNESILLALYRRPNAP